MCVMLQVISAKQAWFEIERNLPVTSINGNLSFFIHSLFPAQFLGRMVTQVLTLSNFGLNDGVHNADH